jgi:ATP-dependent RNA helicase DeaD
MDGYMTLFNKYDISEPVKRSLDKMGFTQPTPIQAEAIPIALQGRDLVGQAPTGTGKTVAFGIPIVEACDLSSKNVQALVITPTRELAVQVAEELKKIGEFKGVSTLPVYGGQDVHRQIHGLRSNPQVIVGTSGRLIDHITRIKTIGLDHVKIVVLDEADKLLEMGFLEDTKAILRKLPEGCQIMLFSATMPEPIIELTHKFMHEPAMIGIKDRQVSIPSIAQYYVEVQEKQKFDVLARLLLIQSPDIAIVFSRTKKRVDELSEALSIKGYSVRGLHGDLEQPERDRIMKLFKDGGIRILVSTDVASRGLDISGVTHIYNIDVPEDPESYVHRIGRTGRMGRSGVAVTFVTSVEKKVLKNMEQYAGQRIMALDIPTDQDAVAGQKRMSGEKIMKAVESKDSLKYADMAETLLKDNDPVAVLSAALGLIIKEPDLRPVELTEMPPGKAKSEEKLIKERDRESKDRARGRKYPRR